MSKEQKKVFYSLIIGVILSIFIIFVGSICDFFHLKNTADKISIAFKVLIIPGVFLVIAVARLAKYRFFSDQDINGSGLTNGSEKAKILQALIQNTLEQLCIAFIAYTSWVAIMPLTSLSTIVLAAITFAIGRSLFFLTYHKGAGARALGFTLTFYPSVIMIITVIVYMLI
ncbi:hypothetical protein CDV26_05415 [Francisella halioticida]|uniref:MAPEG family protein n=1 Tax=Francisella halioticida TaxID=549298 RepID=A0ABM6LZL4_9GAMM|nr:MAPEG family protein [Francisella halioticida]ASG67899.1 hypothetical protein CDV26_05415 [Francisella halioticida]